jgi:5-methyltetrahydrofolate--homocysteine methyltransferase
MLQAAIAMKKGLKLLKPLLLDSGTKRKGTVVIGTVKGDLHDIGKNLVAIMLEGAGFEVVDLGVDISPENFLNSISENKTQVCAMSALLTTTMPGMEDTVKLVKSEFGDQQIRTIVGGAPVSQKYAEDIGADGFAHDAGAAVERVKELIGLAS